ncbi:MAG: flagellar basal body rod protein FlgB [Rhodobacterales bacterium 65-51]|uniref:Flagellar biosynthesis protein FlgB n=1 Tax=Gemmobacter nanjingensis TaxID=488454 RepID=A0ABQ3FN40_9RHOB|nr:FlgB family protein [Gemmobacter nanjingensis]OJY33115.1 MAG: flagellar basal body rod protein FlgB [Rhodobacterales bacterium 65-51]GHC29773.1 flagellar biosynthesis protein FlgB [Gemmobacter nanjingensis]
MFEKLELVRMAQAMAVHAGARQAEIARNVANADTPGFKARDLPPFAEVYDASQDALRRTRPGHLLSGETDGPAPVLRTQRGAAAPNGNTVSLETEMVKSVEVGQQHEMALGIYRSAASILRTSLGRR